MVKIYNGIDVSSYQGAIDFDKVKAGGVDVVMIKAGEAYSKHYRFETYYNGARAAGMKIGAYWYSHATNTALRSNLKTLKNRNAIEPIIRY